MPGGVRVEDLEAFARFRAAVLKFAQGADQSLSNADSQVARAQSWLENEQMRYWESQVRKRMDAVSLAKEAVRKKKLSVDSTRSRSSAVEEEKDLARRQAELEQAHEKIAAIRKWLPRLEKAAGLYRGGVSRLATDLAGEVPKVVALLDRLAGSLEEYVQIEGPAGGGAGEASASGGPGAMARGEAEEPPLPAGGKKEAAGAEQGLENPPGKVDSDSAGGDHVVNG